MAYLWLKAFHIVGVVSWFAGLFYHGRLLVYHVEALTLSEPRRGILASQYQVMESRLFHIIMNPAMGLSLAAGAAMLLTPTGRPYLSEPWMIAKMVSAVLLIAFHFWLRRTMLELARDRVSASAEQLRLLNEVPTLILVLVTVLAVFKAAVPWIGLGVTVAVLVAAILLGASAYRRHRQGKNSPGYVTESEET